MANEKYLKPLQQFAHDHFEIVKGELLAFRMAKMVATGFRGKCNVTRAQLSELGNPPAQSSGVDYLIDLGDMRVIGLLWMKSCHEAIQMGLYASTDISDSINMINNDNLDHVLTDREALIEMSQVITAGIEGFRKMKCYVDDELRSV